MEFRDEAVARAAVIRQALLTAEAELSEGIVTAQGAGLHELAAQVQTVLTKLQAAHRAADVLAIRVGEAVGGPVLRSGGNAGDKEN